jgi:hypothetical protein
MINKKINFLINILFILTIVFIGNVSFAQTNTGINNKSVADATNPLVDCTTVDDCDWNNFLETLNKVKDYGFQLVVVASVIFIVYAGIKMVLARDNAGERETAKNIISNVVIGFFLAAAGWLIVSAILNTLGVTNERLAPQELIKNKSI